MKPGTLNPFATRGLASLPELGISKGLSSSPKRSSGGKKRPTYTLKQLLSTKNLAVAAMAHNSLSAKLVAETGNRVILASDLTSCTLGHGKTNDGSLNVVEAMSKASLEPVLVRGENHWFQNNRNLPVFVRKLERRGVAGLTLPETYFLEEIQKSGSRFLDQLTVFEGAIQECKAGTKDNDFQVIVELGSLQNGWDQGDMIRRAESYRLAGADAILVPFLKDNDVEDLESFSREWNNRHPLVVVPECDTLIEASWLQTMGISMMVQRNDAIRQGLNDLQAMMRQVSLDAKSDLKARGINSLDSNSQELNYKSDEDRDF